ncbi:cell division septum initiation protein DivIVA [Streptomyces canus]|uniref:BlaI/MecI/CopY family transcriptional regulator n=1 Tax=Streptomyces canus TaxID=58343 RepID=UPI00277DA083|nr:BlaI/MecI/CopY family transcriptional regulator [Streptomyces canus]MDQ0604475.1 cell division septum initiation protein DivIVA [Streptomyces canus]
MSENTTTSTELTSQYTAQVTTDLERNLKEQERIHQEIAALQQQLATLQQDHSVLVNMHQALGLTVPTAEPEPTAEADTSPAPAPAKKAGTRRSRQPKKGTTPKAPKAPKASTSAAAKSEAKSAEPTLVSLIRDHLAAQSEPRSTAEIAAAMGQTHPDRGIKATVVRTTLEGLVAKGLVQRVKQGSSVYYTASDAAQPAEEQASTDAQTDTAT